MLNDARSASIALSWPGASIGRTNCSRLTTTP
jgi:hypothetical protein